MSKKEWLQLIILLLFPTIILFAPALRSFFFQDDWFSFSISSISSFDQVGTFFKPVKDAVYYRPLGMQVPFFIFRTLFGLTPAPYRIFTLIVHVINGLILYLIFLKIIKNKLFSAFGALLYMTSAVHFTPMYWFATFAFVLAPTFLLTAFSLFIHKKPALLTVLLFSLGLLVNELVAVLPFLLLSWVLIFEKKRMREIWLYFATLLTYIGLRLTVFVPQVDQQYALTLNPKQILVNLRNFFLWSLNWPETISDHFSTYFSLSSEFVRNFSSELLIWSICTLVISYICIKQFLLGVRTPEKSGLRIQIFGLSWFIVSLLPVLFFKHHAFSYYSILPSVGLILLLINNSKYALGNNSNVGRVSLLILLFTMWFVASFATIKVNQVVHWAPQRARAAEKFLVTLRNVHPNIPSGSVVIAPKDERLRYALFYNIAVQIVYRDPTISTFYGSFEEYRSQFPQSEAAIIELPGLN